jgi:hypothetical protein
MTSCVKKYSYLENEMLQPCQASRPAGDRRRESDDASDGHAAIPRGQPPRRGRSYLADHPIRRMGILKARQAVIVVRRACGGLCVLFCVLPEYQNTPKTPERIPSRPEYPEYQNTEYLFRRPPQAMCSAPTVTGTAFAPHSTQLACMDHVQLTFVR